MPKSRKKSTKKIEDSRNIKDDNVVKESKEKRGDEEMKCEPSHAFHAVDGSSFCSAKDLADALEMMSDDTFYYHVTDSKNDFANWLKDVFHEQELADSLVKARTKEKHEIVLLRHIMKRK